MTRNILRGTLAVILGLVVGGCVNMALILASPHLIPPPAGVDVSNVESMRAGIHLFEPKHFLFPFLAHALGTLSGAWVASRIAVRGRMGIAFLIGAAFLAGGIAAASMIPAPRWFIGLDLVIAYLPMAWIGAVLAGKSRNRDASTRPATGI